MCDQRMDGRTDGRTHPLIDMRDRILKECKECYSLDSAESGSVDAVSEGEEGVAAERNTLK